MIPWQIFKYTLTSSMVLKYINFHLIPLKLQDYWYSNFYGSINSSSFSFMRMNFIHKTSAYSSITEKILLTLLLPNKTVLLLLPPKWLEVDVDIYLFEYHQLHCVYLHYDMF
jgi:hypothetical protein